MAISDALRYQLNTGGSADTLYGIIRDFLATNPDAASTQAQMRQYGISAEDVANATGGKSGGLLSGNILAGASWNSLNTALPEQLTAATGQATSNYAVGGATTADTLTQLNTFLAGGGQFDPNSTVYLQTGGVDFLQGVDKGTIKDNISEIVKTLGDQGVNVVLTGSPYAKSIDDVINNNFDPKVDSLFTEIAKENKNVALVGVQGEILQNKKLLVDALHTNAEGTAIYNQAVIDSLSQFKNEVPSSTPQAIAQVQQTNTVATTPPVITQAAASPAVAQALATQSVDALINAKNLNPAQIAKQTGLSEGEVTSRIGATLPPNQAALFGDTYVQAINRVTGSGEDEQVGALENVITYKANENQAGGAYQQYTPTGELERTGTQQKVAGSFLGGLAEAFNDPVVQLALLGGGAGGALGGALGLTGSTAQAVGTGLIKGGAAAAGGASIGEALKTGLLSGGLVYGAGALDNYLATGSTADVGLTERQFAVQDAKNLASQGLSTNQIQDTLTAGGYNDITVQRAISSITGTPVPSLPIPGAVNVTGTTTPAVSTGGLLGGLVTSTTQAATPATSVATTPTTESVNVTGATQPQMVDQATLNLVNSQLASTVGTPANLANLQVTGQGLLSGADTNTAIAGVIAGLPSVSTPTTQAGTVNVTGDNLASTQQITNAILATVPNVTVQQAQNQAQVLITSGQNLTTSDLVTAVSAVSPNITNTVAEQIITSSNSDAIQPVVSALVSSVSSNLANVEVTGDRLASTQEITNAILATVPNVTVSQAQTQAEVLVTSGQNLTTNDLVSAVSSVSPNITPSVAEQIITSTNSNAIQPVVSALVSTVTPPVSAVAPTTTSNLPNVQVTGDRLASTQEIANAVIATVPNVTPQQAQTQAEVIVTSGQNLKVSDLVDAVSAISPNITNTVAEQIITSDRPITNQEIVSALAGTVTAVNQPIAQQTITANQAAQTQEIASAVTSLIPNVTPAQATTIAETVINSGRPITAQEVASVAAAVVPALAAPSVAAPSMATQTIIGERPSSITDVTAATLPLIQPSTPLTLPQLTAPATTPAAPATTPASTSNPLLNAAGTAGLSSLLSGLGSSTANLISGGLGTAGNLLQMQTSREAAQRAQAMIDAETKAAKDAAQFRPIGMTTRFGTSQFGFDPVTGRLSSAGYNLTPDVKAQQDRFMALSNQGLTQAEQAQGQYAPLQTGAQRLFGLGNQYLAQSPEQVAQNYLNQQMSLLQPGRETELANLQNRLQQQGRGGLSVSQGGTMGATTPELQALYNARAQQEAVLAANAQQAGQRDVMFGSGLLNQGSQAMGQYYGGQQAAYAPYTAAMGQAQNLETLGQQPYNMGINLGQIGAQTGFNVGQLGLKGAQINADLATSANATRNLAAQGLIAAGNPNAMFGQALGGLFGGGLQSAFSQTGLGASGFGTGLAYGNQDLGLFL